MKIGMNMLLWTGHVEEEHVPILRAIKDTGFDGVEVPVFDPSGEIAAVLDMNFHTVDAALRSIYSKLEVNTRTGAVAKALKEKLV